MRLRQILLNLMGNAIKFTNQGEITLKVDWVNEDQRKKIRFSVKDTGIGICSETLHVIFEPFVQSKNAQVHPRAGTGLGLTISKQLVERFGGNLQVTSEEGKGSEFTFTMDVEDFERTDTEMLRLNFSSGPKMAVEVPHLSGRVLVVDDLLDIRLLIGHFVQLTGIEVVYAKDGADAIRIINADKELGKIFDVVLMDIHMPVMDGHEAAQGLRAEGFAQPLIALTAAHMKGDMDRCFESGFTAYLGKPLDQARLYDCLARFLPMVDGLPPVSAKVRTLIVVEDDVDALAAMEGLLTLLGWQVIGVQTAAAALRSVEEHNPHTILIDLNLPDMSGYACAAQIHESYPDVRIIIASGEEVDRQRAADAGVSASLLKPVSLAQLEAALQ
jgi:CheY-like chemotaxis protein